MAGNILPDNSGNIYVEFDYDNIIVVDPNKTTDGNGNIQERLVDPENLVMYANLEAELLPRTKLAVGSSPDVAVNTISIASINFLKGNKDQYFTTGYYDELTGKGTTQGMGQNQTTRSYTIQPGSNRPIVQGTTMNMGQEGAIDNGLLGITSINVRVSTAFIPSVTIELEDVQGRALFQLGQYSPYAAFFNLPYPPFYLTLKGYFGQAIRYQLNLVKFNARFNSFSGNYQITLELQGYKFNILNEIAMGHLFAVPHMYSKNYTLSPSNGNAQSDKAAVKDASKTGENTASNVTGTELKLTQVVSEKGYQKIRDVYSEYKAKGLIDRDFPELTLQQLMYKFETFEKQVLDSYVKADVKPLTDIRIYKEKLEAFFKKVYSQSNSWFNLWCNPDGFVLTDNRVAYVFKDATRENPQEQQTAITQLSQIISDFKNVLLANETLGSAGKSPVPFSIDLDTIKKTDISFVQINDTKTLELRYGREVPSVGPEADSFRKQKSKAFFGSVEQDPLKKLFTISKTPFFVFEDFIDKVRKMENDVNRKLGSYESALTADLATKIQNKDTGIGFVPSVRNIMAVIMASAEGFLRLLDEVHTNSWNVRYDPDRVSAVQKNPSSAKSSDSKDYVPASENTQQNNPEYRNSKTPVYPWPQFFVETNDDRNRFQLKYVADPSVVNLTKAWNYTKWPEVEFVEEYMKGLTQKFNPPVSQPSTENSNITNILNINALEFPETSVAYLNKEEVKFFYEIFERLYVTAYYTGLFRSTNGQIDKLLDGVLDFESKNIVTSIGTSNPYLAFKLKNYKLDSQNYDGFLRNISNDGTGRFYQEFVRDFYVTPYLRTFLEKPTSILSISDLGPEPQLNQINLSDDIKRVISGVPNEPRIVDTYPYTDLNWCETNLTSIELNQNSSRYNTNKVLTVYSQRNVISNFESTDVTNLNRPFTNFSFMNPPNKSTITSFGELYKTALPTNFMPTEGYVYTNSPASYLGIKQLPETTTTSILNTPYFINAIQKGVDIWRQNGKHPYKTAAYLFLNSLPLITLRERVKSEVVNATVNGSTVDLPKSLNDLDYFFATLKKFGAVHKLPYAWLLRAGSLWHRYKTFKETGVDFISDVWKKFDAVENYDPKTKVPTKKYQYKKNGIENIIVLQEQTTTTINMNIGFYPKLITDFNVFYNGYDLFKDYTDEEVQKAVNNGLNIWSYVGSKLSNIAQGNTTLTLNTKSVILPANLEVTVTEQDCKPTQIQSIENNYVIPSFGSNINESEPALVELIGTDTPTVVDGYSISGNESVFNGSVRLFWSAPNYGYFDTSKIVKPPIDSYMAKVVSKSELMSPFQLLNKDEYTKIDDLLSVFDRKTLDLFEEEFLKFSESVVDIKTGDVIQAPFNKSITDSNAPYKNFQFFMRNMMKVPRKLSSETEELYFKNLPTNQFSIVQKQIENFLSYDVLLRMGNPYQYNKRVFNSFLSHQSNPVVVDPIKFEPYEQGTLPTPGGITLSESKQRFPEEWKQLELTIGFSTIEELAYKNSGSYITDFFIDNKIKFTTDNIEILQQLIKMYATQKLDNENIDSGSFKTEITRFLEDSESIRDYFLNGVIKRVQGPKGLPNYSEVPPQKIQSAIDGQQSKVENWEVFKALNDKWIAGGDYSSRTIFEDMLFLDRASRNIGDTLLIDIFNLKDSLSKGTIGSVVQNKMSVLTFISGILINNNFTVMNLPAYVNFYNVTNVDGVSNFKPEGTLDFANNMWGTFLNVDYRNSGPKMVCFYVGKPSTYVALPNNKNYMFRDDGFDMVRSSENPLVENLTSKKDWALSNRCVGFNVDIGTRNQNIFYAFNVGQDNGKATSEAIQTQLDIVNQVNGQNTSTQNVSLYNLYKQRSYTCTISSLGNALLQPTMYFNLRHVPMFYGPYMITEVTHTITPGSFQTQFSGVRQGMFDLPTIDKYLQSLNQNLLTKLEKYVANKKDDSKPITSTTNQGKIGKDANAQDPKKQPENSCENGVNVLYKNDKFVAVPSTAVKLTRKELKDLIDKEISAKQGVPDPVMAATIYSICYFGTFNKSTQTFDSFNNNFSLNINLNFDFSPTYKNFFSKTYCCIKPKQETNLAIANFDKPETFIQFLYARLEKQTNRIKQIGLFKFYSCFFPINNYKDEKYFDKNKNTEHSLKKIRETLNIALTDAKQVNIDVGDINLFLDGPKPVQAEGASVQNAPKCEPPTITRFEPLTASSSEQAPIITITGTNLIGNTQVFIGNQVCRINNNTEKELKVVPQNKVSGKIKIVTTGGSVESQDQFQFIFKNNSTNQSPPPGTTEYDKNLFTNAFALGEYLFTVGYKDGSKLAGRLSLLNGTLSQNYEVKLFLRTSQTRVEITTFEILGGTIDKPTSYGDYLSKSTGWKETLSLASENNQLKSVNFEIYIPAFGLTKNVFKSIIPFDCPDESLVAYDIIDVKEFETISKNPCCECYYTGTGGNQIIINGVTCNPTGAGC